MSRFSGFWIARAGRAHNMTSIDPTENIAEIWCVHTHSRMCAHTLPKEGPPVVLPAFAGGPRRPAPGPRPLVGSLAPHERLFELALEQSESSSETLRFKLTHPPLPRSPANHGIFITAMPRPISDRFDSTWKGKEHSTSRASESNK